MTKYVIRYWSSKTVTEEKQTSMTIKEIKQTLREDYYIDLPDDAPDKEWLDLLHNEIYDDPDGFSWEYESEDQDSVDYGIEFHKQNK